MFVSLTNGTDNRTCGRRRTPCKHLQYALQQHTTGHTFYVDGGIKVQLVYNFNTTINIAGDLRILRWPINGSYYPILTSALPGAALLEFDDKQNTRNCLFLEISFMKTDIANFVNSGSIHFDECRILNGSRLIGDIASAVTADVTVLNSMIERSSMIYTPSEILIRISILIQNSSLNNVTLQMYGINSKLNVQNSTFNESDFGVYPLDACDFHYVGNYCDISLYFNRFTSASGIPVVQIKKVSKVKIVGNIFDGVNLFVDNVPEMRITDSKFLNSKSAAIQVYTVGKFVFESCLVADNREEIGTLTIFNVSEALISNCIFMNNRAAFGGAVRNIESNVRITDSVFKDNQATISGGTIHSSGINGYISLRNVLVSGSAAYKRVLGRLVYCETVIHTENVSLIAHNNTETSPIFIYRWPRYKYGHLHSKWN